LLPLWLLAPGSSDTSSVFLRMSGVLPHSNERKFALAALQGSHLNLNVASHGQPVPWGPDDVMYTKSVLRDVLKRVDVDMSRIRCVGFSRGGRFCSRLASELSSFISAIAPVSGIRFPEPNNSTRPMPIIAFHGTNDPINPWQGNGNPQYWHEPVLGAVQRWADRNGCVTYKEHEVTSNVIYCMHLDCQDNANVYLVKIRGGGHTWPGTSWTYRPAWRYGKVNKDIDANAQIFEFFAQHHRPATCHTAKQGETCHSHVVWVKHTGLKTQPRLYKDLTNASTFEDVQAFLRRHIFADCPSPCQAKMKKKKPHKQKPLVGKAEQNKVETLVTWRPHELLLAAPGFGFLTLAAGFAWKRGWNHKPGFQRLSPREIFIGVEKPGTPHSQQTLPLVVAEHGDDCMNDF